MYTLRLYHQMALLVSMFSTGVTRTPTQLKHIQFLYYVSVAETLLDTWNWVGGGGC